MNGGGIRVCTVNQFLVRTVYGTVNGRCTMGRTWYGYPCRDAVGFYDTRRPCWNHGHLNNNGDTEEIERVRRKYEVLRSLLLKCANT